MKFVGRKIELERLEEYYSMDSIRTCAIYGRRRIGKTTLIDKFCEDKTSIRFNLIGSDPDIILNHIADDISRYSGDGPGKIREGINDFDDLLSYISSLEPVDKLVVVMDEFPDAIEQFRDVPASMMRYVDGRLKEQNVFLIICGSSISAMMRELNDGNRPLFQRFPIQMRVGALPYKDARRFHDGLSEEDRMRMFSIASGIPLYHELMSAFGSPEDAIKALFLGPAPPLLNEARNLLAMEVSPYSTYNSIMTHIGRGATDVKTISEKTGLSKTRCKEILDNLKELGLVEGRVPYGSGGKKISYSISDGFMDFNYSILLQDESILELNADSAYTALLGRINTFYGKRFESICAQYIASTRDCTWIGNWWGNIPVREDGEIVRDGYGKAITMGTDIDVVAKVMNGDLQSVMMVECKFTRRRSGIQELEELIETSRIAAKGGENLEYMIVSRSGFTSELLDRADENHPSITLVSMDDLTEWAEKI